MGLREIFAIENISKVKYFGGHFAMKAYLHF
jgi:hypothetical protein